MEDQTPVMLTIAECAKRTGLSYDALRKMCHRGEIVYVKCGRKFLINFSKLLEYLNHGI